MVRNLKAKKGVIINGDIASSVLRRISRSGDQSIESSVEGRSVRVNVLSPKVESSQTLDEDQNEIETQIV